MRLPKIVVIVGTNASGKSALGLELARRFDGEIISADSRQVYEGFDLCSGKVSTRERAAVPHHLIDERAVGAPFSVADFQKRAYALIPEIIGRGRLPFVVGGTGLYVDSVAYGYELSAAAPDYAARAALGLKSPAELRGELDALGVDYSAENESDAANKRRLIRMIEKARAGVASRGGYSPRFSPLLLGLSWNKEALHKRIDERLSARLAAGMLDEARAYLRSGGDGEILRGLGLEYRYARDYLTGAFASYDDFYAGLSRAIKRFAKRQTTWFKKNKRVIWLDASGDCVPRAAAEIERFLGA